MKNSSYIMHVNRLLSYYLKKVTFYIYSLIIFLTKPGALILIPIAIILFSYLMRDKMNRSDFAIHETIRIVRDISSVVKAASNYDGLSKYIYEIYPSQIAMILGALTLPLIWLLSLIIRPVIGSLPVIPPPIKPRMLVLPKSIEMKAYPVKIVAPSFTPPAWDGNHQVLIDQLNPKLREIMTRDHRAVDRQIEQSLESVPTHNDVQSVKRSGAVVHPGVCKFC